MLYRALAIVGGSFLFSLLVAGCQSRLPPVTGDFAGIPVAIHSIKTASLDVYQGFTCASCASVASVEKALREKYGSRVVIHNHYVLRRGRPEDPMKLYLLAERAGKGKVVAQALLQARLGAKAPRQRVREVGSIAKRFGLGSAFVHALGTKRMARRIQSVINKTRGQLRYNPALVLNHRMMFGCDLANAEHIISESLARS